MRQFYVTFEHLIHEIAKFGVVGALAFLLTAALNNGFHFGFNLGPLTSFGLATAIAAVASYFANRHWTWKHKDDSGLGRGLTLFMLLSAVGLGISEIPVGFSEYVLNQHSALAYNISSTLVGTASAPTTPLTPPWSDHHSRARAQRGTTTLNHTTAARRSPW